MLPLPTVTLTEAPCWYLVHTNGDDTGEDSRHYATQREAAADTQSHVPGTAPVQMPHRCVMLECAYGEPADDEMLIHFTSRSEAIAYAVNGGWHARNGGLVCERCGIAALS